ALAAQDGLTDPRKDSKTGCHSPAHPSVERCDKRRVESQVRTGLTGFHRGPLWARPEAESDWTRSSPAAVTPCADARSVVQRGRETYGAAPHLPESREVFPMKVVVIGGTGLIGSKVVEKLNAHGHDASPAAPQTGCNTITNEGVTEAVA